MMRVVHVGCDPKGTIACGIASELYLRRKDFGFFCALGGQRGSVWFSSIRRCGLSRGKDMMFGSGFLVLLFSGFGLSSNSEKFSNVFYIPSIIYLNHILVYTARVWSDQTNVVTSSS